MKLWSFCLMSSCKQPITLRCRRQSRSQRHFVSSVSVYLNLQIEYLQSDEDNLDQAFKECQTIRREEEKLRLVVEIAYIVQFLCCLVWNMVKRINLNVTFANYIYYIIKIKWMFWMESYTTVAYQHPSLWSYWTKIGLASFKNIFFLFNNGVINSCSKLSQIFPHYSKANR